VPTGALGLGLAAVPALAPTGFAAFPAGLGGIVDSRQLSGNVDRLFRGTVILRKLPDPEKFKYPRIKNLEIRMSKHEWQLKVQISYDARSTARNRKKNKHVYLQYEI
jgi:hypothetical protein